MGKQVIVFCIFILGVVGHLNSQCVEGDCNNGSGTFLFQKSGIRYTGAFQNGKPQGVGQAVYPDGKHYEGLWALGAFQGQGTMYLSDGTEIAGMWDKGMFKGQPITPHDHRPTPQGSIAYTPTQGVIPIVQSNTRKLSTTASSQPVKPIVTSSFPSSKPAAAYILPVEKKIPQFWAISVGIAAYTGIKKLNYTDDDAYRMYAFWKSVEGGSLDDIHAKVLVDESATRDNILSTMRELYAQAGPDDMILLYFSGHGVEGAFLPYDYDGDNIKVMHSEVKEILEQSPAKYKLCIADACHSGSLLASRDGTKKKTASEKYYSALLETKPGTALFMSSLSDEESLESTPLRQGVFSHYLLRGLKGEADADKNGIVTIRELFEYVQRNVVKFASDNGRYQTPVIQGDYDSKMPVAVAR